ncbi:MAG: phenylacetate--CoA ligase family protein [Ferruginibacter sp.]|nr:phenylacetate--CoA ligase family protein [Ferruginibacter sp.]
MKFLFDAALFFEKLTNGEVRTAHRLLDRADSADRSGIEAMKNEAFLNLIKQVYGFSPYYQAIFKEYGLEPSSFKDISDIQKLPFLTKDNIKAQRDSLLSINIDPAECITRNSGGTTGEPIKMEINKQARINDLYFYYRGLRWMGYSPGQPMVKFFGGSLGGNNAPTLKNKIKKWVSNELFLPAFSLTRENAEQYLDIIKSKGKTFLQGYVSSLYTLAIYAKELNFKGLQIQGAFTTAEQLPTEQAAFMSEVFKCDVKGFFGCAEINCLGFQTKMGGNYIVPDEIVHMENCKHPQTGIDNAFLITSLYNYRTPLLRYLNGDTGKLVQGEKYTEIQELSGRTADMFLKSDGSYVSSILATQTMQISGLSEKIKRYQLIQTQPGSITFKYEPFSTDLSGEEKNHLLSVFQQRLGREFVIELNNTTEFVKSLGGKHRLMINNVNK